jgi:hypothetical protein
MENMERRRQHRHQYLRLQSGVHVCARKPQESTGAEQALLIALLTLRLHTIDQPYLVTPHQAPMLELFPVGFQVFGIRRVDLQNLQSNHAMYFNAL